MDIAIGLRQPLWLPVFFWRDDTAFVQRVDDASVTHNAFDMIEEIRRQFRGTGYWRVHCKPDYARCVSLAAEGALSSLILPAFQRWVCLVGRFRSWS